jgi:hypothetical protein
MLYFKARLHNSEKRLCHVRMSVLSPACLFVCPSACNNAGLPELISMKFDTGTIRKCVEEVNIYLQSGKNIGHFTWRPKYVLTMLPTWIHHEGVCVKLITVICLVTWTHHSVTLYAHCLSCLCMSAPVNYVQTTFVLTTNLYRVAVCRVPFKRESD